MGCLTDRAESFRRQDYPAVMTDTQQSDDVSMTETRKESGKLPKVNTDNTVLVIE
jgi:hypothetical protein